MSAQMAGPFPRVLVRQVCSGAWEHTGSPIPGRLARCENRWFKSRALRPKHDVISPLGQPEPKASRAPEPGGWV